MLVHRLRRWPIIDPAMGGSQYKIFITGVAKLKKKFQTSKKNLEVGGWIQGHFG